MRRFAVLRVPNHGPKALIASPAVFESRQEAQSRIDAVLAAQLKTHHTSLEVFEFEGDLHLQLEARGILF